MAEVTPEEIDRLLDNVPQRNELSHEVMSVLAWQAKNMKDLFENAYPDRAFLDLRERVRSEIVNLIVSGQLRSGAPRKEEQVVGLFNEKLLNDVSREAVQEALAILVRDGFLQNIHSQEDPEFVVVKVSADEALEVLSLSEEMEVMAVKQLLTSEQKRDELAPLVRAQGMRDDQRGPMFAETAFHAALAQSAGLDDAAYAIERWRQKLHLYTLTPDGRGKTDALNQGHNDLFGALSEKRSGALAAREPQLQSVLRLLDQHQEETARSLRLR